MAWPARTFALLLSLVVLSGAFRVPARGRNASVQEAVQEAMRGNASVEEAMRGSASVEETMRRNTSLAEVEKSRGDIQKLYTWGAAAVLRGGFLPDPRRADRCWQGLRIVNINADTWHGTWYVDIVNGVANLAGYWHANQPTVKMDEVGNVNNFPCGDDASRWAEIPSVAIHLQSAYEERADSLSGEARTLTKYFVVPTYYSVQEAADYIKPTGWKLVGSSMWEEKETHLMQDPSSKDCVLSFKGTSGDRVLDWWDSLRFYDSDFCGLGVNVHAGFRNQLRKIVKIASFRENIQSKLPKCRDVIVIGHSLGGALAALYSYCVNAAPTDGMDGWEDYQHMEYFRSEPEVLPPIA